MDPYQSVERLLSEDEQGIEVSWADGHRSIYPFRYLRGYCPCASCQGHGGGPLRWQGTGEVGLVGVKLVGHYGINPVWDDGHETGIFADRVLRRICPCPECLDWQDDGQAIERLPEV